MAPALLPHLTLSHGPSLVRGTVRPGGDRGKPGLIVTVGECGPSVPREASVGGCCFLPTGLCEIRPHLMALRGRTTLHVSFPPTESPGAGYGTGFGVCQLLAVWPGASSLTTSSPSFCACRMRVYTYILHRVVRIPEPTPLSGRPGARPKRGAQEVQGSRSCPPQRRSTAAPHPS